MPPAPLGTAETLEASAPDLAGLPTVNVQGEQPAQAELPDAPTQLTRFGHYVLLHELGRGGMGVVYAAYDEKLDRKVAIKVLRAQGDPGAQRRLVREAQGLARLSHPNVVQIYEIGDIDGQGFLAMEFIDGSTLRSWRVEQPRTFAEILAAALAAGRGLAAAHAKSLVHRDFKPDNVMIHRDGRVLVTDFGLVRGDETAETPEAPAPTGELRAELTRVGSVMGTPGYLGMEGSVAEASLRNSVGSVYLKQADYEPALAFYRRALSIYESKLGPGQPAVSASLNNIATVLRSQGKHAESLEPYTRALEIRETTLGPENPAIAYPLHGLGLSYLALGDHARARGYLERAVALRALTGEPARLADSRFGLARVMWAADERAPAHALALIARQGFLDAGPGSEKDLARVDAWLREHAPP